MSVNAKLFHFATISTHRPLRFILPTSSSSKLTSRHFISTKHPIHNGGLDLDSASDFLRSIPPSGAITLNYTSDHKCAILTLRNPSRRNALTPSMMIDLATHIQYLEDACFKKKDDGDGDGGRCIEKDTVALLLRGEEGYFCSGADLHLARQRLASPEGGAAMSRFMGHWTSRLRRLPLISVAAIKGGVVGGGTELASACDHRLMENGAIWRCVHVSHGLVPGWGGGVRMTKLVGRSAALKILAGGLGVDAKEALRIGLVDGVIDTTANEEETLVDNGDDDEKFTEDCLRWMEKQGYFQWEAKAVHAAKRVLSSADCCEYEEEASLERERSIFCEVWPPHAITKD